MHLWRNKGVKGPETELDFYPLLRVDNRRLTLGLKGRVSRLRLLAYLLRNELDAGVDGVPRNSVQSDTVPYGPYNPIIIAAPECVW